jgi:hypothetical protein
MIDTLKGHSLAEHIKVNSNWTLEWVHLFESSILCDFHQREESAGDVCVFWVDVDLSSLGDMKEILDCKMMQV